ncbi:phosphodiester glycosidase family protein [Falsiroseomonas ponticola]|uniref:phosphodiester glycosidase family protein n=1 Tax=Falsiroseomonas ponticola TaxID=2786951 RepID=UPI0019322E53|nr:phosphodiester glycosidase family protein [Roseomonas ponticola]
MRRRLAWLAGLALLAILAGLAWAYAQAGLYGVTIVLRRGGSYWVDVTRDDARLSPSMRLALRDPMPEVRAGPIAWRSLAEGFEVAEMPVLAGEAEVDRLLLARIDPRHFRLIARAAPAGNRDLQDWRRALGAVLVVNGSFYDRYGDPDTPMVSDGQRLGPATYEARHGAVVSDASGTRLLDLRGQDWRAALAGARDGVVSWPLLLAPDGSIRAAGDPRWLANRSFLAEDRAGRILIGTTADAFFSLRRFADFLRDAPLDLSIALNLDGGPVACQGIRLAGYERDFCGLWETQTVEDRIRLLHWPLWWRRFGLPVVLAVVPR